ncbi:Gfo/Idh/MocA family oxidoreductase [Lactococcus lactis]|uniref:Gfo/Idh/MocA family oxidoreductase n=1 Tax=Lactococcus lactis TaxID=1358 RepID=UPI00241105A9|nr:Gfo/Idh/MocA family oxidoreductase [Lactococcus lactis]
MGCGAIFQYVYPAIHDNSGYTIVGLCDTNFEKLKPFLSKYPTYTSYRVMANKISKDTTIIILVSHIVRKDILKFFLEKNFKIICEKPLFWKNKQLEVFEGTNPSWPTVIYHRLFNDRLPMIRQLIKNNRQNIMRIKIVYVEDISIQTEGHEYEVTQDTDGGGCINDNFPNCVSILLFLLGIKVKLISIKKSTKKGITMKAEIEVQVDDIPCVILLDWGSKFDEKSVSVETQNAKFFYDLQYGYFPAKSSLYHEYENFFLSWNLDTDESREVTILVTQLLGLINSNI